ncbi:unnamed protein product [Dracunculus medinensis]|uniref:DUF19 domain-containing protein n=1 Tax=Dracunculus medinensis TaxID=318479 RepID=A0A0N4UMR8_DRAME|nr:unnamed protein product [Dracunculus medinensis]
MFPTCACRLPYLTVGSQSERDVLNTGFVFVNRKDINEIRRRLRNAPSGLAIRGKKVLKTHMCTLTFMDKVDECLFDVSIYNDEIHRKSADGVVITLNPLVKMDKLDLEKMCLLYRKALICMGRTIYRECRRTHPILAEIDAIYGYSCGYKQYLFLHHLDCIQKSHIKSYRLAVCEDSTHRALRFIESSSFSIEEKQKQKCETLNWLMNCEKATMQRLCSMEASIVNDESLMSASQYVAPECHPDFERKVFVSDNENDLIEKENLICTKKQQEEIKYNFRFLDSDVRRHESAFSAVYPIAYSYPKPMLSNRCADYQKAYANITAIAKKNCLRRYQPYNTVYFTLEYPCGHGTMDNFFKHFDCLQRIRRERHVQQCERSATRAINDPSNDPCEAYSILAHCIYDSVVRRCGYTGWETEYQYLALTVNYMVPSCRIKRIIRNADFSFIED